MTELRSLARLMLASASLSLAAPTWAAPPDTLQQRVAACIACHAVEERRDAYFPRIAGKPAGYLYNQLLNFRDGRRNYPMMSYMVAQLSDEYLREIAEFFAAQHPVYPPAAPGSGANAGAGALARGRQLVLHGDASRKIPACVSCHGAALGGVAPAIPGLLGLPSDYINAQFGAWRSGTRRAAAPDCMADIAGRLAADDVAALSGWLSQQAPDAAARPAAAQSLPAPLPLRCGGLDQQVTP
ncbi:cytochrome c4 precursor [Duganella phyllosphaerae]|uniref:Cytochrome c4 n=1 Tax=Duganella phyllosphaerae TaxID=762836 RepID=A0A1E7WPU8_9BURK|nr:cytochrome c4 precursor [Duganella phyllosphaerae]